MSEMISADERAYLTTLMTQEQTTLAALQATRRSFEAHLATKYTLRQGDTIDADGHIVRADPGPAVQE